MKAPYVQLVLCVGMLGFVVFALPNSTFKIELGPNTVKQLSEVSKKTIQGTDITPFLKQFDTFATPERALRYGSLLSLMIALPYSSRLAWNVLEKNLLNLNRANELGLSDRFIHYGSILTLLLVMPYEGRFLWDVIQKKFFTPSPASTEQQQP
jgi:hypothetical protein